MTSSADAASGLATAVLDDPLVLLSELVGNAVRHGAAPIGLRLGIDGGSVRVDVGDGGGPFEHDSVSTPSTRPTSGRGLFLVEALAAR